LPSTPITSRIIASKHSTSKHEHRELPVRNINIKEI